MQNAERWLRGEEEGPALLFRLRNDALNNPDPAERSGALEKLAESADQKQALETALEVLGRVRSPEVLKTALSLLSVQESVPLEPLLKLAASDQAQDLRLQALELLGKHGARDTRVRELFTTLAKSEEDEDLQETAKILLQDVGSD